MMIPKPKHPGLMTPEGKFIPDDPAYFKWDASNFKGQRCCASFDEEKRSDEFNKYYWGSVNAIFVDFFNREKSFGKVVKPEFVHEILACKFVGYMKQTLPGGEVVEMRIPTRTLSTKKFSDFVKYSKEWGESFFNLVFPELPKQKK